MSVSLVQVSDQNTALRYDEVDATTAYIGIAAIGSAESNPVWQIKKLTFNSGIVITWADGDQAYDNVWTDRSTLTYI